MIFLIGASGSGKSTLAKRLVEKGYKEVVSYTTRPKRYEGEEGHIFVDEYSGDGSGNCVSRDGNLVPVVAYSKFNGYEYWCTQEQLDTCDEEGKGVYVVDWPGVDMLKAKGIDGVVVYIDVSEEERVRRMKLRGDSDEMIESRIENDRKMFPESRKHEADVVLEDMTLEDMEAIIDGL